MYINFRETQSHFQVPVHITVYRSRSPSPEPISTGRAITTRTYSEDFDDDETAMSVKTAGVDSDSDYTYTGSRSPSPTRSAFTWQLCIFIQWFKGTVSLFLEWRIDRCTKKCSGRIKKLVKKLKCHIFASIRPTERYNHLKWGAKGHLFPLETSFFIYPTDRQQKTSLWKIRHSRNQPTMALLVVIYLRGYIDLRQNVFLWYSFI